MKKNVYEIDSKGFISEIYLGEFDDKGILINPKGNFITVDLPQPLTFFKPKWNGVKWTEGATQEEIAEYTKVEPLPLSQEERIRELESIVNLLLMGGL